MEKIFFGKYLSSYGATILLVSTNSLLVELVVVSNRSSIGRTELSFFEENLVSLSGNTLTVNEKRHCLWRYPISKMQGNLFTIRSLAILRWFNRFDIFDSFEINDVIVYFSSTVELALTANSPQKPLHLVPAGSPYNDSCLTSSQRPHLYNGNGHYSASTATNSTAASFFQPLTKKVRNSREI